MHTSVESEEGFMLLSLFQGGKSTSVAFKVARDIPQQAPVFQWTWLQI